MTKLLSYVAWIRRGSSEMNLHSIIQRYVIVFLSLSIYRCPLLLTGCHYMKATCGYLTVKPAPLFLLGSNLTVFCHNIKCPWRSKLILVLNGNIVQTAKKVNSTTEMFELTNVQKPLSVVLCKLRSDSGNFIIGGLDLQGGLRPDKPKNVTCETWRSSPFISCSWEKGRETHLPTAYNISVRRDNGTLILSDHIQHAETVNISRLVMDEDAKYQLSITDYNQFGKSESYLIFCVKDIVLPETPRIMQISFRNNSVEAFLQWNTTEPSEHLRAFIHLRTHGGDWTAGHGTEFHKGLIKVDGLKPLTEYEFKMRTCLSGTMPSCTNQKLLCSKWSLSERGTSPRTGPSQQLHVWRILGSQGAPRNITVLWKPPCAADYTGEVEHYKIFNKQMEEMICASALSQCSVQIPSDFQSLCISAVTLDGVSPPADVPLRHSDESGPVLGQVTPEDDGSAVLLSWSGGEPRSIHGPQQLHYVLEWTSVPLANLQWKRVNKEENSTSITGLTAGVRYNISLYAVTTAGVSDPSSCEIYSKEQKPMSGPNLSVLCHEAGRIQIQWDDLPVDQQRGFITGYTIYLQTLDSSWTERNVTVFSSSSQQMWLDCPEGALALQATASTSAGEGKRGSRIVSQPVDTAVGVSSLFMIFFIILLFLGIIINMMCWTCVKERFKQKCMSRTPNWFHERLPKPENSIAIRLLKISGTEPTFLFTDSDPPLSPVSLLSHEERDMYPNVQAAEPQVQSGQSTTETPLLTSDPGSVHIDSQLEKVSYKPQIAMLATHMDVMENEEEQRGVPTSRNQGRFSCEGLLGGFLSMVEVDPSDSPVQVTLSSVSCQSWPKTPQTSSDGGFSLRMSGTEKHMEEDPPCQDTQEGEMMVYGTEEPHSSQNTIETWLTGGYFPQVAAVSSTMTHGDSKNDILRY